MPRMASLVAPGHSAKSCRGPENTSLTAFMYRSDSGDGVIGGIRVFRTSEMSSPLLLHLPKADRYYF